MILSGHVVFGFEQDSTKIYCPCQLYTMPRTKVHPSQLGNVEKIHGSFCARFQPRDFGQTTNFRGPHHETEDAAMEDLWAIRTAGAEQPTRMGALEAMRQEAKRLKDQSKSDRGGLHFHGDEVCARIQYNEDGIRHDIYGPSRTEERRARADLDAICAAGENKPSRAEYLEILRFGCLTKPLQKLTVWWTVWILLSCFVRPRTRKGPNGIICTKRSI